MLFYKDSQRFVHRDVFRGIYFFCKVELPAAFLDRLQRDYPAEYGQRREAFYAATGVSVNVHPRKFLRLYPGRMLAWNPIGFLLDERPSFIYDPWFHGGAYYVQEAGSQLVGKVFSMLQLPEHPVVLDLCAAPGGKSVHLANLISGNGVLVSNEPIKGRLGVLQENIVKSGWQNSIITQADPTAFHVHRNLFDVILVDAPCSGEGMFRKSEEAREQWTPDLVRFCAARQSRLLEEVWPALKPGGFLMYSTCTLNALENEAQLEQLLREPDARSVSLSLPEAWGLNPGTSNTACWYNWPGNGGGEGFFLGVVQKEGQTGGEKSNHGTSNKRLQLPQVNEWLLPETEVLDFDDGIYIITESTRHISSLLKRNIRVVQSGTAVGVLHGQKFKPDPALALSVAFNIAAVTALNLNDSIAFLCGDGVLPAQPREGWNAVAYEGLPLGWINFLGKRSNNLWPAPWRIRKRPKADSPAPFWQS